MTVVLKWKIWIDLKLQLTVCVNCDSHGLYVKMDTTTMLHKVISEVSSWSFKLILGLLVLKIQDFFFYFCQIGSVVYLVDRVFFEIVCKCVKVWDLLVLWVQCVESALKSLIYCL